MTRLPSSSTCCERLPHERLRRFCARSLEPQQANTLTSTMAAREELYTFMDAANVDLKAFTEALYKRLRTGPSRRRPRDAQVSKVQDEGLVRDHSTADSCHNDSPEEKAERMGDGGSDLTCRCISLPSTLTTRCWICPVRRPSR